MGHMFLLTRQVQEVPSMKNLLVVSLRSVLNEIIIINGDYDI